MEHWKVKVRDGDFMSILQEEVVKKISSLSDDNVLFILELIDRFMQPVKVENKELSVNRIGIVKGEDLYDEDYDFDEMNDEIIEFLIGKGYEVIIIKDINQMWISSNLDFQLGDDMSDCFKYDNSTTSRLHTINHWNGE